MGRREETLLGLLGRRARKSDTAAATSQGLSPQLRGKLNETYQALGGVMNDAHFRAGKWDLIFEGSIQLELDEEQHFIRYRLMTLQLGRVKAMPWADSYSRLCKDNESLCTKKAGHGGWWSTPSATKQFGPSDAPKVFGESGAARWKQRAFYDLLRDLVADAGNATLARLSVYDRVHGVELREILDGRCHVSSEALVELIESRIYNPENRVDVECQKQLPSSNETKFRENLTPGQVASRIGRHASTTRDLAHRGFFPNAYRSGDGPRARILIPDSDVGDFLRKYGADDVHGYVPGFRL